MVDSNKIVRSICYFTDNPKSQIVDRLEQLAEKLRQKDFILQTLRICSAKQDISQLETKVSDKSIYLSVGTLTLTQAKSQINDFFSAKNTSFNIDLTTVIEVDQYIDLLFQIINNKPEKTFLFTWVFNNKLSSSYYPSAAYEKNGFSIGLQPTNLAIDCNSIEEWLAKLKDVWLEIYNLFNGLPDFLGIDSSIAPLLGKEASFIHFIKRIDPSFSHTTTTNIYFKITKFLAENNPKPIGLCGLMFPCLEDDELANEYENGNFTIERNIYLSLHSGLGIDTYPVGINENPKRIGEILTTVQALSTKYNKALSVRFVTDGKAKIGEKTNFQNEFLRDVVIKAL